MNKKCRAGWNEEKRSSWNTICWASLWADSVTWARVSSFKPFKLRRIKKLSFTALVPFCVFRCESQEQDEDAQSQRWGQMCQLLLWLSNVTPLMFLRGRALNRRGTGRFPSSRWALNFWRNTIGFSSMNSFHVLFLKLPKNGGKKNYFVPQNRFSCWTGFILQEVPLSFLT